MFCDFVSSRFRERLNIVLSVKEVKDYTGVKVDCVVVLTGIVSIKIQRNFKQN